MDESLGRLGVKLGVLERCVVARWSAVVGQQIAASTRAEKVSDGVLFVACRSSAWANELALHKAQMVSALNAAVGTKVVCDIRFSARGFRGGERKEEAKQEEKVSDAMPLRQAEIEAARRAASHVLDPELGKRIEKAVLTGMRRARAAADEQKGHCLSD